MSMIAKLKKVSSEKLNVFLKDSSKLGEFLFEEGSGNFDLDKSWHAIHYLINGAVWEFSSVGGSLFLGGDLLSEEDMGYGPARYFSSGQVEEISLELEKISNESLVSNFSKLVELGDEIYPGFQNIDEDREYIVQNFQALKEFLKNASKEKMYLISFMS